MREILFRGKRVYNGEWVFGCLIQCGITGKQYIFPVGNDANESEKVGEDGCLKLVAFEIIPETVGQYTGLTDKSGVKIFEGDILSVGYIDSDEVRKCVVKFGEFTDMNANGDITLGFFLEFSKFKCSILNGKDLGYNLSDICEVIGSIHDNPELLEGVAE